jgi:putative SbcD/Mre11-related phosphoesterase
MIAPIPNHPAIIVKHGKEKTLAVADLHIGWEMALSEKGIHVPSQTQKLLVRLTGLLSTYKPEKLLILGDLKHTIATAVTAEWHDVPDFLGELKKHVEEICIVRGNHDGNLEPLLLEKMKVLPATGVACGEIGFFHGHQWPSPSLLKCETLVMGHVHPVVALRDPAGFRITKQVWIKAKCDGVELAKTLLQKSRIRVEKSLKETLLERYRVAVKASQLFIMPSFNDFLGGRPLNERKIGGAARSEMVVGPVLRSKAVDIENAEAYLLDGTLLGTLNQLKTLS